MTNTNKVQVNEGPLSNPKVRKTAEEILQLIQYGGDPVEATEVVCEWQKLDRAEKLDVVSVINLFLNNKKS